MLTEAQTVREDIQSAPKITQLPESGCSCASVITLTVNSKAADSGCRSTIKMHALEFDSCYMAAICVTFSAGDKADVNAAKQRLNTDRRQFTHLTVSPPIRPPSKASDKADKGYSEQLCLWALHVIWHFLRFKISITDAILCLTALTVQCTTNIVFCFFLFCFGVHGFMFLVFFMDISMSFFFFFAYSSICLTNLITFFLVVVHVLGTEKVFCSGVRQHLDSSGALEASCSIFKLSASSRPHVCFYIKILKFFNFSFPSSACETTLKSSTQQLLHPHHISNSNQVWFSAVLERKTDVGTLP